jgi:antitoxin component YwqK of YwqJK toxin-antitoxin module
MTAKGRMRVAVLAAAAGSAGFGFPPPSRLACPPGTKMRQGGELAGIRHELYCARLDGTKHGPSRLFESGVRTEGAYANGRGVGSWRSWYPNGRPFRRYELVAGWLDGLETTWDLDGTIISKGGYRAGQREGPWMVNDLSVTGRGNYRHGAREGRWSFSSEGHRIAAGAYRDGQFEGPWVFYWPGGGLDSRGTFRRNLKEGRWRFFGQERWPQIDIQCRAGRAHGDFVALDEHGRVALRGRFDDGAGGVRRVDGTPPPWGLCGYDCWARDHCHTDRDYRTVEDE